MRHLKTVSYAITGLGAILVVSALLLDLSPTALLIGLMMIIAGGVKIAMILLWNGVAGFGTPVETEGNAPTLRVTQQSKREGRRP